MPDRIELCSGTCPWLDRLQLLLFLVAAVLLLTLATPWHWKLATLIALCTVYASVLRHNARSHPADQLTVRLDGTVWTKSSDIELSGVVEGAWVSRCLCVIHWAATGDARQRHSLVCAANNRPEDFRRMLVLLRLGPRPARDTLTW